MSKAAELANLIGNINAGGGGVNRNVVINGNMSVAQRSTSETGLGGSDGYFTCDRWRHVFNTSGRITSAQDGSDTPDTNGFANCLKISTTTADTSIASGEYLFLQQKIEGQNLQAFAKGTSTAKPFALSFYVKGNASATYVAELYDNDNSRQVSKAFNVTTSWNRVELSIPADTTGAFDDDNAASMNLSIWLHAGSSYTSGTLNETWGSVTAANRVVGISSILDSTSRTFSITGVQLEVGQNPTEFEHEPFERTLSKCQRYLFSMDSSVNLTADSYSKYCVGPIISSTIGRPQVNFPVQMRGKPSLVTSSASTLGLNHGSNSNTALSSLALNPHSNVHTGTIEASVSSGLSAGDSCCLSSNNNQTSFVRFDAEL